ncbi:MAG: TerC family protein [Alphaproteobacteria bacterium]
MEFLFDPQIWVSLLTLTVLEIVLGIDNLIFIAVLVERLEPSQRERGRRLGILMALVTRLILLSAISWIVGLTQPLFVAFGETISWRDLILIGGGLFLLTKATREIHEGIEGEGEAGPKKGLHAGFVAVILQIAALDVIFSLDSVITAVGMVDELAIMVTAVVLSMIVMLAAANSVSDFISRHPTIKMLAFSFLLLIGMALVADGAGFYIPKGYLYAAMGFSVFVEFLNTLARRTRKNA